MKIRTLNNKFNSDFRRADEQGETLNDYDIFSKSKSPVDEFLNILEGIDEDKKFKTNVGSGFTDLQRKEFWEDKDKLIGQIIEIRADSISKSQDGENWSLRFPRFKSFRGFDKKEKL